MSSDSDSDICGSTSDVSRRMSNLHEKFLKTFHPRQHSFEEPTSPTRDLELPSTSLSRLRPRIDKEVQTVKGKGKGKGKKKASPRLKATLRPNSNYSDDPQPSTSGVSIQIDSDDDLNLLSRVNNLQRDANLLEETSSGAKRKRPIIKKGVKKLKPRLGNQETQTESNGGSTSGCNSVTNKIRALDIHDMSTDEDTPPPSAEINPCVIIKLLWKSIEMKTFRVRKFDKLSVITDYLVDTYNVNSKLLLFTVNDKEVDLKENTYVSLRLNFESIIEGGVLPDSYLNKENVNCEKKVGMKLKVQLEDRKHFFVHLIPGDNLDIVYAAVMNKLNLPFNKFKVRFDGDIVQHTDSVDSLGLEEGDIFDIILL